MVIIGCAATALFGRFAYLVRPFDHDAAMFVYLGKSFCDGDRFCHDIIDNKFPSVGLVTSVFWRMFGTNWAAYIVAQTAMSFFAVGMLARCAARNIGEHALLPTALAAMVYLNFTVAVFGGFQLETMQIFFAVIAASSAIDALRTGSRADAFVVGLSGGCAAMLKPTGLAPVGVFWILLIVQMLRGPGPHFDKRSARKRSAVQIVTSLIGLLLPATVVTIHLVRFDLLDDMPALVRQISEYASSTPIVWHEDIFKPITVLVLAGFAILIRGIVFRRERLETAEPVDRRIVWFAGIWFTLEFLGGVMQRRMYGYHFLPVGAPAALLFGMIPRRERAAPLAGALGPIMIISVLGARVILQYPDPRGDLLPTSAYLLEHASPGDAVWQDSMPRLLLETGLHPGARYPLMFLFGNTDTAALEYTPIILDDFQRRKPKFIILPTDMDEKLAGETEYCAHLSRSPVRAENFCRAWRAIERYTKENYTPVARLRGDTVYRRKLN